MNKFRISTITGISKLSNIINLSNVFNHLQISDTIHYIKFNDQSKGVCTKKKKTKKEFFNQLTIHVYDNKIINVKLFNNGRIQMTGLKRIDQGIDIIKLLFRNLERIDNIELYDINDIKLDIVLINSDFDVGYLIDRDVLYRHLIDMGIYVTYEPCMYPGVNIKYYYNNNQCNGICDCCTQCNGKGNGCGDGQCKKVTIAVFHSGKIIITGGRSIDQINTSYVFINKILDDLFNKK